MLHRWNEQNLQQVVDNHDFYNCYLLPKSYILSLEILSKMTNPGC